MLDIYLYQYYNLRPLESIHKNSNWVWSGNTTIINRRQPNGTSRKSHSTITRHQEDKLSKATSSLFPIKMIAILEWTWSNIQQNTNPESPSRNPSQIGHNSKRKEYAPSGYSKRKEYAPSGYSKRKEYAPSREHILTFKSSPYENRK